jgi:uncharacterized membrane protein YgcG
LKSWRPDDDTVPAKRVRVHVVANDASSRALEAMRAHLATSTREEPAVALVYGKRSVNAVLPPSLAKQNDPRGCFRKRMLVVNIGSRAVLVVNGALSEGAPPPREVALRVVRGAQAAHAAPSQECTVCLETVEGAGDTCETVPCPACDAHVCMDCFAKVVRTALFTEAHGAVPTFVCPSCRFAKRTPNMFGDLPVSDEGTERWSDAEEALLEAIRALESSRPSPSDERAPPSMLLVSGDPGVHARKLGVRSFNVSLDDEASSASDSASASSSASDSASASSSVSGDSRQDAGGGSSSGSSGSGGSSRRRRVNLQTQHEQLTWKDLATPGTIFAVGWFPRKCRRCAGNCGHAGDPHKELGTGRAYGVMEDGVSVAEIRHGWLGMVACFWNE